MIANQTWSQGPWTVTLATSDTTTSTVNAVVRWIPPTRRFERITEAFRKVADEIAATCRWWDVAALVTTLERSSAPALERIATSRPRTCALSSSWRARGPPC